MQRKSHKNVEYNTESQGGIASKANIVKNRMDKGENKMAVTRFTGKTESDAVMNAAMELGIPSTEIQYAVIDKGATDFRTL